MPWGFRLCGAWVYGSSAEIAMPRHKHTMQMSRRSELMGHICHPLGERAGISCNRALRREGDDVTTNGDPCFPPPR